MSAPLRVTVAVAAIAGTDHLRRCLDALLAQEGAPPFDVVVASDPHLRGIEALIPQYPSVRFLPNQIQRTPVELASRALRAAGGDLILVTEDHCTPRPDWARRLYEAQLVEGRAAVGGAVETEPGGNPVTWAFYLVDYFRYMLPFPEGPAPALTVCNVSYRRVQLDAIADLWRDVFHETAVNAALRERFGPLWLVPAAEVRTRRSVRLGDAVYERYAFGRMFACNRNRFSRGGQRIVYALLAPALPPVIMWRMAKRAMRRPEARWQFVRALLPLLAMVGAWTWGEWLGYITDRLPRSVDAAPELRAAARG